MSLGVTSTYISIINDIHYAPNRFLYPDFLHNSSTVSLHLLTNLVNNSSTTPFVFVYVPWSWFAKEKVVSLNLGNDFLKLNYTSTFTTSSTGIHQKSSSFFNLICLNVESNLSTHPQANSITPLSSFVSFHQA